MKLVLKREAMCNGAEVMLVLKVKLFLKAVLMRWTASEGRGEARS